MRSWRGYNRSHRRHRTSSCWRARAGALGHSLALRQEREQGRWPECFDALWQAIEAKVGASEAARQIVDATASSVRGR